VGAVAVILETVDQVPGSSTVKGPRLSFRVAEVTAREIVRTRVRIEVERHNSDPQPSRFVGLIEPPKEEQALNGPRRERPRRLDVESQIAAALEAVRRGRVIILFNGEQVGDLDAPLLVTPVSEARFLRLVSLAGG
jgi:hypothetical protein